MICILPFAALFGAENHTLKKFIHACSLKQNNQKGKNKTKTKAKQKQKTMQCKNKQTKLELYSKCDIKWILTSFDL